MSNESTNQKVEQVEEAIDHINKTVEIINSLKDASSIRMINHADGGHYLLLENQNILRAQKAYYLSRKGLLMVSGYDQSGDLYLDGMTLSIIEAELPINARDALVSREALSVIDKAMAQFGKASADPYTIDCQIIDSTVHIKDLTLFSETISHKGFKFGVVLSDGTEGEILVERTPASQYLLDDEIMAYRHSHQTMATADSVPDFEVFYELSTISIASFEIHLRDEDFLHLAATGSIDVRLE